MVLGTRWVRRHRRSIGWTVAVLGPFVVMLAVFPLWDGDFLLLPASLLIVPIAAAAMLGGLVAAGVATVSSAVILVAIFAPATEMETSVSSQLESLTVFILVAAGIGVLVDRMEAARVQTWQASQLLERVLTTAPVGFALFDQDRRFLQVNPTTAAMNRLPSADHLGRRLTDVLGEAGVEADHCVAQVLATGRPILEREVSGLNVRTSARMTVLASYLPLRWRSDQPCVGMLVVDITERARLEEWRRESEELFRSMADNAPVMIVMRGENRGCTYLNRQWVEFTGRPAAEQLGEGWIEFVHPDDRADVRAAIDAAFEAQEPFELTFRLRRADGEYRWVRDRAQPRIVDGRFLGTIGTAYDVTEERRTRTHLDLLAELGSLVQVELDSRARLRELTRIVVPAFADLALVYLARHDGLELQHVTFADPEAQAAFDGLPSWPVHSLGDPTPFAEAFNTAQPVLQVDLDPGLPDRMHSGASLEFILGLDVQSALWAPVVLEGTVVGVLAFFYAESGRHYGSGDVAFAEELARRSAAALGDALEFERERNTAETLQMALLPQSLPAPAGVHLASRYLPGSAGLRIGGDWYDALELPSGEVILAIGDVAGHGVTAAAMMAQLRSALHVLALDDSSPASLLARLNRNTGHDRGEMTTLLVLRVDVMAGTMVAASAGHPPLLLRDADGCRFVEVPAGVPLRALNAVEYHETEIPLPPDATVVLYTDGLVERRHESLDVGLERLRAATADGPTDEEALAAHLIHGLLDEDTPDDVALLVARFDRTRVGFDVELPATARELVGLRHRVQRWLVGTGLDDGVSRDVTLAVHEAAANAVRHAYWRHPTRGSSDDVTFRVSARRENGSLWVVVSDRGRWREPSADGRGGRGIDLMRALMDDVEVHTDELGTRVTMARGF